MKHDQTQLVDRRAKDLVRLARALYESALHEEDRARLEMHRRVAVELKQLLDEVTNEDGLLHPDLGLGLLLFIELKAGGSSETETDRQEVLQIIEQLEAGSLHRGARG